MQAWKKEAEKFARSRLGKSSRRSRSFGSAYKREINKLSASFSTMVSKLEIYRPVGLMRHFDLQTANLLRYASILNCRVVVEMIKDKSMMMNGGEKDTFTRLSFMALGRGFLLDRFVQKGNFAPDTFPKLPKWKTLTKRWYDDVLLKEKWLVAWSDEFSRDLVDMQWLEIAENFDQKAMDPRSPAWHEVLRISILHGMIARRFLLLGAISDWTEDA